MYMKMFLIHNVDITRNEEEKKLVTDYNQLLNGYNYSLQFSEVFQFQKRMLLEINKFRKLNNKKLIEFFKYEEECCKKKYLSKFQKFELIYDNVYIDSYHENYNILVTEYNRKIDQMNFMIGTIFFKIINYDMTCLPELNYQNFDELNLLTYFKNNYEKMTKLDSIIKYIMHKFNDYTLKKKILLFKNKIEAQKRTKKRMKNCYEYNDCYIDINSNSSWADEDYNWTFDPQ